MYSELQVRKQGRNSWILTEDWHTPYGIIPKGFTSNGASIPRLLWWFIPPAGILFEAAIIHDYYYTNALRDKLYADSIFRVAAEYFGATRLESKLAFIGVRLIGRGNYK